MFSLLTRLFILTAGLAGAAGPGDLASLKEGQEAAGAFRAAALYLDPSGDIKGARFLHERGMTVDLLFFDSVPQLSLCFRTPPDDDSGASHTLEHLVLGKGSAGRRLNTLMPMRMGGYTAGTHTHMTNYQFSSAAGPAEFYELLEAFLGALVRPDVSDEEIRREVAHFAVVEDSASLRLEEKGTVYTEMVARMEQPVYVRWGQVQKMLFGPAHPLARNQGGEPEEIWKLTPGAIRAFHKAHYRLDGNASMIAALPPGWEAADFLKKLDAAIKSLEPGRPAGAPRELPSFSPMKERGIWIGRYPSMDASVPQHALLAWPPVATLGVDESLRAELAAEIAGSGETSYLYRDLVDQKTRKFDSGATGISAGVQSLPASYATVGIAGLPAASVTPDGLQRLRDAVLERLRWLHGLKPGSAELAETAEKARPLILARRRSTLRAMQGPPKFGERHSGDSWHRFLDQLAAEPGFSKSLGEDAALDGLLAELDAGRNPWAAALERAGMLETPYVSAVLPDAELLERQKERKRERLAAAAVKISTDLRLPEAEAFAAYRADTASATAVLAALERDTPKPSFLREPPLDLDTLDWAESRLPSGPKLVTTRFSTPFTDIKVSFDLRGVPEKDWELLPLLGSALGSVGVETRSGEKLDYVRARERIMTEIQGAGLWVSAHPRSERAELTVAAYASSPAEVDKAAQWLENYIFRTGLSGASRGRLVDLLRSRIQNARGIFQRDTEYWISSAVSAYKYQDRPLYMHTSSPFTELRHLNRLRWRLEAPGPEALAALRAAAALVIDAAKTLDRAGAGKVLAKTEGELGEYLRWEFELLPEDSWRADLRRIAEEFLADIGRPEETITRLKELSSRVLARAGAKVHINGNAANSKRAAAAVDALLARLPEGKPAKAPVRRGLVEKRLCDRLPGTGLPAHAALVNNSAKTGTVNSWSPASAYHSFDKEGLLDSLALGVLAGGGAHSLFMRTWSAGLAYSNGLGHSRSTGEAVYSADKCPDPAQTLRFVTDIAGGTGVEDPFLLEYSLAGAFRDYRADGDFSSRGGSLAYDLEEGNRPELVREYKSALLRLARDPATPELVRGRFGKAMGRVLAGMPGVKISEYPGAGVFLTGPEAVVRHYEDYLRERGDTSPVVRLYPRDFWP